MKKDIFEYISIICLYFTIIIMIIDIKEIKRKINDIEKRNLEVHEYILNRIEG